MGFQAKHGPLERVKKTKLSPKERQINMIVAAREFRARKKGRGYKIYQCWLPNEIRQDVKAVVKDMVNDWEEKNPLVKAPPQSVLKSDRVNTTGSAE